MTPGRNAWLLGGVAAIAPVLAIALLVRVLVGVEGPATHGYAPDTLEIAGPAWRTIAWTGFGLAVLVQIVAFVRLRRQWRPLVLCIVGALLAGAITCSGTIRYSFEAAPRTVLPTFESRDGAHYAVVHYSMMQGMTLRICRVERDDAWSTELRTLASGAFDSPRRYQHVLVPAGTAEPSSGIYEGPGGFLVCGVHGQGALLRVFVACHAPSEAAYANEGAYFLSPFVLFDGDDTGDEAALAALIEHVAANVDATQPAGLPRDDVLVADLDHANPWVRAAAARLVEAGGDGLYPDATARLRDTR